MKRFAAVSARIAGGALALGALALAALPPPSAGAEASPGAPDLAPAPEVYVVHDGDTLWDVSDKFFRNPFYWPKLWEENDYISNPHVLMPGDALQLAPGAGDRRRAREAAGFGHGAADGGGDLSGGAKDDGAPVRPGVRTFFFPEARHAGFISEEGIEGLGMVVGGEIERYYYEPGDTVYLTFPSDQNPQVGDKMATYVQGREVFEPGTTDKIGAFLRFSGVVEIVQFVEEGSYTARVLEAYGEIHRRNFVRPFVPRVADIVVKDSPSEAEGKIVIFDNELIRAGQNSLVYINLGLEEGVEVGNKLTVYAPGPRVYDPLSEEKVTFPEYRVGELVVVSADARTAAALVTESPRNVSVGDLVRVAK